MDFFNSLTLDLKILVVAIVGCTLLALVSGNANTEKRYLIVLALLAAAGVYRFTRTAGEGPAGLSAAESSATQVVTAPPKHVPLASTSAR